MITIKLKVLAKWLNHYILTLSILILIFSGLLYLLLVLYKFYIRMLIQGEALLWFIAEYSPSSSVWSHLVLISFNILQVI
jgi:hypothetical protein